MSRPALYRRLEKYGIDGVSLSARFARLPRRSSTRSSPGWRSSCCGRAGLWLLAVEAVFALSLLLGPRLLRGLRRGLQPLEEASRLLAESDFTTRFREVGQPEVDRLVGVYNRMADELREERTRNQEQQGLLARILAVAPAGVVILDFDGRVTFANPAAGRLLGRPAEDARWASPRGGRHRPLPRARRAPPGRVGGRAPRRRPPRALPPGDASSTAASPAPSCSSRS